MRRAEAEPIVARRVGRGRRGEEPEADDWDGNGADEC
jgi:hypothetical protein